MINLKPRQLLVYLEVAMLIFYSLVTIGAGLLIFDIWSYGTKFTFYILGWPIFARSFFACIAYYVILLTLPIVSIVLHRNKYLFLNIGLIIVIIMHLGLFIFSLTGLARL